MDRGGTVQLLRSLRGTEMPDPSALILPMKGMEFAIWIGEGQPMAHYVERMDSESDVQQFCRFPACWSHVPRATCNNPAASRRLR
jgi:hypothetical protein